MKLQLSKRLSEADLLAYVASARYDREVAGTTLNGLPILTDRESQSLVTGAIIYLQNKPEGTTVPFTTTAGTVSMTLGDLIPLGLAIGDHVQALRGKQLLIEDLIRSGEVITTAQIDQAFDLPDDLGVSTS